MGWDTHGYDARMTESTNPPQASSTTSEADADNSSGTTAPDEPTLGGISDDELPDDLQPTDDNPLAKPLDPDDENTKSREELDLLGDAGDSQGDSGDSGGDSGAS